MCINVKPEPMISRSEGAVRRFLLRREEGVITSLSLFLLVVMLMIGGLALDVMNMTVQRTKLQVTADAVAHAAILARRSNSEDDAIDMAHDLALMNMPPERYGDAIQRQDIQFGRWDAEAEAFTPDPGVRDAVRVVPQRDLGRGNAVPTYLLYLVGLDHWDLRTEAIFLAERDPCFNDGFVARGPVSFNSNNHFASEFCVHSNDHVWLRQNNVFEPGARVSMPNLDDLDVPGGDTSGNPGLDEALVEARMELEILDQLPDIIADLTEFGSEHVPGYVHASGVIELDAGDISASDFQTGRIHRVSCESGGNQGGGNQGGGQGGGNRLDIPNNAVLHNIVLVTDCAISFGQGSAVEESIIATTSTSDQSIRGSAGARFGRDNGCAGGAGTQVLTRGGMFFPANLTVYGGQLIAAGTINFQANAGVSGEGVSFVAGEIDGRTNMTTGHCGTEMDHHFGEPRMRMVW